MLMTIRVTITMLHRGSRRAPVGVAGAEIAFFLKGKKVTELRRYPGFGASWS